MGPLGIVLLLSCLVFIGAAFVQKYNANKIKFMPPYKISQLAEVKKRITWGIVFGIIAIMMIVFGYFVKQPNF